MCICKVLENRTFIIHQIKLLCTCVASHTNQFDAVRWYRGGYLSQLYTAVNPLGSRSFLSNASS